MPLFKYTLPAEWEPQSGILLTWPNAETDWKPYLSDINNTYLKLASEIAKREKLIIASQYPNDSLKALKSALTDNENDNVCIYYSLINDTWARDHGAITLVDDTNEIGNPKRFRLLDFKFNGWGKKFQSDKDNTITRNLYMQGAFKGELFDNNDFVLEGGSIESDGKGSIMTTSFCLLAPNRNQPLTQKGIEKELLTRLNATRIIWLNHGQLIGDDTDGHIDTIVRFAPNDTILYVGCDDKIDPQYNDFLLLEEELKELRTLDGNHYRLLRLPMPKPIYDDGERLPATYANFLILNGAIIVPTYNQPELDRKAMDVIGEAFHDREIVGIDATTIVRQHGSIHCLTMQFPQGALK